MQLTKLLKCRLGPDAEPANMASRGELQQVQVVHLPKFMLILVSSQDWQPAINFLRATYLDDINTGNVPESLGDALVLVVDDKGTQLLDVTAVPQLSLASAHAAGGVDPVVREIGENTNCINSYKK